MAVWRMKYLKAVALMDSCSEQIAGTVCTDTVNGPRRCATPLIGFCAHVQRRGSAAGCRVKGLQYRRPL